VVAAGPLSFGGGTEIIAVEQFMHDPFIIFTGLAAGAPSSVAQGPEVGLLFVGWGQEHATEENPSRHPQSVVQIGPQRLLEFGKDIEARFGVATSDAVAGSEDANGPQRIPFVFR
jgi:hypothetical protein